MKPIYVSATVQDSGKTSLSLGLMQVLHHRGLNPGYSKPVGQHYVHYHENYIDEDAVLVHKIFDMKDDDPYCLSPIAVKRGFTREFIFNPDVKPLEKEILECADKLNRNHPMLIIEGTGHAGVGSCFSLSNARVAELIGTKVIIVTSGGIGKPIDEVALNMSLFKHHDVEVIGVVLNKVLKSKYDKITETVKRGLENIGTRLLGSVPYVPELTYFKVAQLVEKFDYDIVSGYDALPNRIKHIIVSAMQPEKAREYVKENTLVIIPGDRPDNIRASAEALNTYGRANGAIILSGNLDLEPDLLGFLEESGIPVLASSEDTFTISSKMVDLEFKIRSFDDDKIKILRDLTEEYVDIDYVLDALSE
jgi:BioD-like phosphotransacetylase family protein